LVETTPEHPFYVEGKGWVEADELQTGDKVHQADGTTGTVWLKWNVHKTQEMYNLTIDTAHTFFVGEGQWSVHNACKPKKMPDYDRGAFGDVDSQVRDAVFKRDNYTCAYCGRRGGDLTIDHIVSAKNKWVDGAWKWTDAQRNKWFNKMSNLATACPTCNKSKGAKKLSDWLDCRCSEIMEKPKCLKS
jgi:hypothetical protein